MKYILFDSLEVNVRIYISFKIFLLINAHNCKRMIYKRSKLILNTNLDKCHREIKKFKAQKSYRRAKKTLRNV